MPNLQEEEEEAVFIRNSVTNEDPPNAHQEVEGLSLFMIHSQRKRKKREIFSLKTVTRVEGESSPNTRRMRHSLLSMKSLAGILLTRNARTSDKDFGQVRRGLEVKSKVVQKS